MTDKTNDALTELMDAPGWDQARQVVAQRDELLGQPVATTLDLMVREFTRGPLGNYLRQIHESGQLPALYLTRQDTPAVTHARYLLRLLERRALLAVLRSEAGPDAMAGPTAVETALNEMLEYMQYLVRPADVAVLIELCRAAAALAKRLGDPILGARLNDQLAHSLQDLDDGNAAENQDQALAAFLAAADGYGHGGKPGRRAETLYQAGLLLLSRSHGTHTENLLTAIERLGQALEFFTANDHPEYYIPVQYNIGYAYAELAWQRVSADIVQLPAYNPAAPDSSAQREQTAAYFEQAIPHLQAALDVAGPDTTRDQWAMIEWKLGAVYRDRLAGDRSWNLHQAIEHFEQALTVDTPAAAPQQWAELQNELGNSYRLLGSVEPGLARALALEHYEQALTVFTRESSPDWWETLQQNITGTALDAIQFAEEPAAVERAIRALDGLLASAGPATGSGAGTGAVAQDKQEPAGPAAAQWVTWARLAGEGERRLARMQPDRPDYLQRALARYRAALDNLDPAADPVERAVMHDALAAAYMELGDEAAANEQFAAGVAELAAGGTPEQQAYHHRGLASSYFQSLASNRGEYVELAIKHDEQALALLTPAADPDAWVGVQIALSAMYLNRVAGERADNVERAIDHARQGLAAATRDAAPADWALLQNNLGDALRVRVRGAAAENLLEALEHFKLSLEVYARDEHPRDWALAQMSLGNTYRALAPLSSKPAEFWRQAIVDYEAALAGLGQPEDPGLWLRFRANLAGAYLESAEAVEGEERTTAVESAIEIYESILKAVARERQPLEWAEMQMSIGSAYRKRSRGAHDANVAAARRHYELALEVFAPDTWPERHRMTQNSLGGLLFDEGRWSEALNAYDGASAAAETLRSAAFTEAGRMDEIRGQSVMHSRAAFCLLRMGRPAEALVRLEQGKTYLLTEALAIASVLDALPETRRHEMQGLRQTIAGLEAEQRLPADTPGQRSAVELGRLLRQARQELADILAALRASRPDLLSAALELPAILALAPTGGAMVMPIVTPSGGAAFVVPSGAQTITAEHVLDLPDLTDDALEDLLIGSEERPGWLRAYRQFLLAIQLAGQPGGAVGNGVEAQDGPPSPIPDWPAELQGFTGQIWDLFMGRVHERLAELGLAEGAPVVLFAPGGLALLPLHAAWREAAGAPRTFLDDFTVSYAPSAYALAAGVRRSGEPARQNRSLLAVIDPLGNLPFADIEGQDVAAAFPAGSRALLAADAAIESVVRKALPARGYLHFACHGLYDWREVMDSQLLLAGGSALSLAEILSPDVDLNAARLVVLSACDTGLTEFRRLPDEYIGLPAGFLQAGAPAVVGSLWAVNDLSTALLMGEFYRRHLGRPAQGVAEALRGAQLWLRALDRNAVLERLETARAAAGPGDVARLDAYNAVYWNMLEDPDPQPRPFDHPYYWAAFFANGAAL